MRFAVDGRYIQDHFPGIGRYTYNLVCALAKEIRDDTLMLLHNPRPLNTRYDLARVGSNVRAVPCETPIMSLREQISLPRAVRRLDADLLHSPYYIKPYWLPVPSVLTYYDVIGLVFPAALPSARARLLFWLASWLALAGAHKVILLSEAARQDVEQRFRIPREKTVVVHPAADGRFAPRPPEAVARVREQYGLDGPYALYLGTTKPHKNILLLLEAWARARPPARLVLAGAEDSRYPYPRERARSLGLEREVAFLGSVGEADLPALYSGAALFVFPSLYEGFGLPVLEAMACGAPVLSSNAASLPEVVGDAGVLLPPDDPDAWSHALADLLSRPDQLQAMRHRSLARAEDFSWRRAAQETLAVYREVLA